MNIFSTPNVRPVDDSHRTASAVRASSKGQSGKSGCRKPRSIYNVLFGDAILVSIPETDEHGADTVVHLLIDVGNALAGKAGDDAVFKTVLADIQKELGGLPADRSRRERRTTVRFLSSGANIRTCKCPQPGENTNMNGA